MFKRALTLILTLTLLTTAAACNSSSSNQPANPSKPLNFMIIKGFLAIGAVNLFAANANGSTLNNYDITVSTAPDEISAKLLSGEVDIAAIPTNMAATLFNKSDGQIMIVAINTTGVTKLICTDGSVQTLQDLRGKEIYGSGQGAIPEYALEYVLAANGIDSKTDLEIIYRPGHEEVATMMATDLINIATIPEPAATQVIMRNPNAQIVLDLTTEWDKLQTGAILSQGCVVVQKRLLDESPEVVANFMADYKESCLAAIDDVDEAATLCAEYDILTRAQALKAIPASNQVFISGKEMQDGLEPFFEVLYAANPKSIGDALPTSDFYYIP